jgi:chorismate mutase-like protein
MGIEDWRKEIDAIDGELLRLVNRRARIALRLGALKSVAGLPLADPERERDVLARARRGNSGPLDGEAVARIFRRIIRESRRAETAAAHARVAEGAEV